MVRLAVAGNTFSDVEPISGRVGRKYSLEDMFRTVKEMQVSGIEVGTGLLNTRLSELRETAGNYNVPILGVNDGIPEYGGSPDLNSFRALLGRLKEAGATYVTSMFTDRVSVGQAIANILERKRAAEEAGITYYLETHRHTITESPEDTRIIADAIPDLKFNLDLSHWIILGYTPSEISWIFPRAGHMQVRIACPDNVQVEVADGKAREVETFMDEIVAPILEIGSVGIVVTELIPQLMSTQKYYPVDETFHLLELLRSRFGDYISG